MPLSPVRIVFVSSEVAPFCSTGGLGDVSAALPRALLSLPGGPVVHVVVPLYREARTGLEASGIRLRDSGVGVEHQIAGEIRGGRFFTLASEGEPTIHFLDCPVYFDREGIYGAPGRDDFSDNAHRYAFLCYATLSGAADLLGHEPDIYHLNDWPTALLAVLVRTRQAPGATVLTLHNLAHQGLYGPEVLEEIGLPRRLYTSEGLEFHGQVSFLKAGIVFADTMTTVSPTYAREILEPELGAGLDALLRQRCDRLAGILNGIDTGIWDPATDPLLEANFRADELAGKTLCRRALLEEMSLPVHDDMPLMGSVSRLVHQKGIDLVADLVPRLPELGVRLVVLGSGDPGLEGRLRSLAEAYPEHLAVRVGYDVPLSHRIEAGADIFLMPSRFEPCGLSQMCSMAYGTVPVARAVGGLRDSIVDLSHESLADGTATGFLFGEATSEALEGSVRRALHVFDNDKRTWRALMRAGMRRDFGWGPAARAYLEIYRGTAGGTDSPS